MSLMKKFALLYSENLKEYDLGHVLTQDRYQNFMDLFADKLGSHPDFEIVVPSPAGHDELLLVHTEEYIRRVERLESRDPWDTPLSAGLVRAAKLLAGAGRLAGELTFTGQCRKSFVVGGGVQHANRTQERGFGVFSDVGLCAENLKKNFGVQRILVIDTDAHAGEGLYDIFCEDPQVLFISLHQNPATLYPGRGFVKEIGRGAGMGYSVNVPLPPRSGDGVYEYILEEIFAPLAEEFLPEIILMVDGSDPHYTDRLTSMGLTLAGIRKIGEMISRKAEEVCQGRVVDFVGSGYSADLNIVSRGWLASIAGVSGIHLEVAEPGPLPAAIRADAGLAEAKETARSLKSQLAGYWRCFSA
jgi:acetoin utilization protein AcuC